MWRKLRLWSLKTPKQPCIGELNNSDSTCCTYSNDGEFVFIGTRNGHIDVYKVPVQVERLVDICRRVINQLTERENINKLKLPKHLENFLCYDDVKPIRETKVEKNLLSTSMVENASPNYLVNHDNIRMVYETLLLT